MEKTDIRSKITAKVATDTTYQNAKKQGDKSKARIEHDAAPAARHGRPAERRHRTFQQYSDNEGFKRWLADTVFGLTCEENAA